jgi:large subunit ribosomal protein L18
MNKVIASNRRRARIRAKIHGTAVRPRLVVTLSLIRSSAQIIDDEAGRTLVSAAELKTDTGTKTIRAKAVGQRVAEAAKKAGISEVVFDRAGHPYRGRTQAIAEGAREKGLKF